MPTIQFHRLFHNQHVPFCNRKSHESHEKNKNHITYILPVVQAEYLLMKGEAFQAMEVLESDNPQTISEKTTHFLARRDAEIETGNIEAALQSFRAYTSGLETWFTKVSNQDVRYIEEKYQQWVREQKHHQRSVLYLLLAVPALDRPERHSEQHRPVVCLVSPGFCARTRELRSRLHRDGLLLLVRSGVKG